MEDIVQEVESIKANIEDVADKAADKVRQIVDELEEDARINKSFPEVMEAYGILLVHA